VSSQLGIETLQAISPDDVRAALECPECWDDLDGEALTGLVEAGIALYGTTEDEGLVPLMVPLYDQWAERVAADERIEACEGVAERVKRHELSPSALLPLLMLDPAVGVTARAALGYTAFMPFKDGDPLTGPNAATGILAMPTGPATRVGIFVALLALGDQRVTRLLREQRDTLAPEELRVLSHWPAETLFEATAHFWVEWLEELPGDRDDPRFGLVAAAFVNQVREGAASDVLDVEVSFPFDVSSRGATVIRRTTLARYLRGLRPRLAALAEREPEPKIVPRVIEIVDDVIRDGQARNIEEGRELYRAAMKRGDDATALEVLDVLRAMVPDDPVLFINSAYCMHALGRTGEAKELLLGGPASLRERPLFHYNLACYEAQLGDLPEARRRLARAVELRPDLAEGATTDPDLAPLRLRVC